MHDCPRCRVPLHGHEETCPSCGERQYVEPQYRNSHVPKAPPFNFMPIIVVIVIVIGVGIYAAQSSWIGQVMSHKNDVADPLDSMTQAQARDMIENGINQGLTAVGATGKITYKAEGQPADKTVAGPVEMTVDTKLASPDQHKAVIEPIKQYMEKARIPTLVMNDSKSRANWTYQVTLTAPVADDANPLDAAPGAPATAAPPPAQ
jgi:hypothetical protein